MPLSTPVDPASALILLHPDDNVVVSRMALAAGSTVTIDGAALQLTQALGVGHKLARCALQRGDKVRKYGAVIGSMSAACERGAHVHMHNLKSDYTASHTREVVGHD